MPISGAHLKPIKSVVLGGNPSINIYSGGWIGQSVIHSLLQVVGRWAQA